MFDTFKKILLKNKNINNLFIIPGIICGLSYSFYNGLYSINYVIKKNRKNNLFFYIITTTFGLFIGFSIGFICGFLWPISLIIIGDRLIKK